MVDRLQVHNDYNKHMAQNRINLSLYANRAGYAGNPPQTIWGWRKWVVREFYSNMLINCNGLSRLAKPIDCNGLLCPVNPNNQNCPSCPVSPINCNNLSSASLILLSAATTSHAYIILSSAATASSAFLILLVTAMATLSNSYTAHAYASKGVFPDIFISRQHSTSSKGDRKSVV